MSVIDGEPDRRSYACAREAAWQVMAITTREGATAPETRQRSVIENSTRFNAKKDTVQKVHKATANEEPMKSEISKVLEILRGPLPDDSVLEFIVSEDGYNKIIEEREKSNRKYRVWYDGESQKVTINCCPSYLHERMSLIVIDSMVDEAVRVMRNAGVSNQATSRIQNAGHLTRSAITRRKSYKEPNGLIIFDDDECIDPGRIAFELGFSQSYSSLRQATLWWMEQKKATVAVLLCLTEVDKNSGAAHRVFRTVEDRNAEMQTYLIEFNRQRREEHRPLGPLEYNEYKWFGTLRDAFFETYRETDTGIVKSEPVYLVKDGVDITDSIPRDLTVKVGDFVPHNWLKRRRCQTISCQFSPGPDIRGRSV
ncbi:hypothetical protein V1505DRAFT_367796 [Lipomyces doorenjongii]